MTPKENMKAFFKGDDYEYIPAFLVDNIHFSPEEIVEYPTRGLVYQQGGFDASKAGGRGWFNVDWVYDPQSRGAMDVNRVLGDVWDWREELVWPDLDAIDWEGIRKKNEDYLNTDLIVTCKIYSSYFERLISFMDFSDAAVALIDPDSSDDIFELFDRLTDLYIDFIARCKKYFGMDYLQIHDDWGNQRSAMFSLATYSEKIAPHVKRLVDACHGMDIIYDQHSCGQITDLFPGIIETGMDTWFGQENLGIKYDLVKKHGDRFIYGVTVEPGARDREEAVRYVDELFEQYRPYKVWYWVSPRDMEPYVMEYVKDKLRNSR